MTCLPALLTACAVIAASLLGGCSDNLIVSGGDAPAAPPAAQRAAPPPTGPQPGQQQLGDRLASAALDNQDLSQVRGGFEASSGVVLNFAFQQATFVDHNLAQTVVVPTLTISPGKGMVSVAGASPVLGGLPPNVNVSSLTGLGVSAQNQSAAVSGAKILSNGTVQTQVSVAAPVIQALVNSGMTSIVSSLGNGGLTSVISNIANNRVVQQTTTIDIGVSGLSSLMRQSVPTSVLNRLNGPNVFR